MLFSFPTFRKEIERSESDVIGETKTATIRWFGHEKKKEKVSIVEWLSSKVPIVARAKKMASIRTKSSDVWTNLP